MSWKSPSVRLWASKLTTRTLLSGFLSGAFAQNCSAPSSDANARILIGAPALTPSTLNGKYKSVMPEGSKRYCVPSSAPSDAHLLPFQWYSFAVSLSYTQTSLSAPKVGGSAIEPGVPNGLYAAAAPPPPCVSRYTNRSPSLFQSPPVHAIRSALLSQDV